MADARLHAAILEFQARILLGLSFPIILLGEQEQNVPVAKSVGNLHSQPLKLLAIIHCTHRGIILKANSVFGAFNKHKNFGLLELFSVQTYVTKCHTAVHLSSLLFTDDAMAVVFPLLPVHWLCGLVVSISGPQQVARHWLCSVFTVLVLQTQMTGEHDICGFIWVGQHMDFWYAHPFGRLYYQT